MSIKTYFIKVILWILSWPLFPSRVRLAGMRSIGCKIGKGSVIAPHVFYGSRNVTIGINCFVNVHTFLDGAGQLIIEDYARIGPHSRVLTASHDIWPSPLRRHPDDFKPAKTIIGRGAWVGMGVLCLPGVHIAEGCVIAAGAVVTTSTTPNGLYAGTPAKRLRDLPIIDGAEHQVLNAFERSKPTLHKASNHLSSK